jgi:hypothetical protein
MRAASIGIVEVGDGIESILRVHRRDSQLVHGLRHNRRCIVCR